MCEQNLNLEQRGSWQQSPFETLRRFQLFNKIVTFYGARKFVDCRNWSVTYLQPIWREYNLILLHNEELNALYCSPNIVLVIKWRRMRWAGHVARIGEKRGVYRVLVGMPEGKRPLLRHRRGSEDNIKMDLQEVGCGVWARSSWLRIGTGGGHLWMR